MKAKDPVFTIEDIKAMVPHRYPFLMVERILESEAQYCVGLKNVSYNEPYFQGHFPGESIVPGVLIAESMVQTAAFIGAKRRRDGIEPPQKMFCTGINIRYRKPAVPGDQMIIKMKIIKTMGPMTKCSGQVEVNGEIIASGEFSLARMEEA